MRGGPARGTRLPSKLVRPTTTGALARTRLFSLIDKLLRERSIVWIAGPPGAGKTVLASTYVERKRLSALWYQLDAGDHDPASFFYFLAVAAERAMGGKRGSLPLATAEYLLDLAEFARRFFPPAL
jgi:LuxR family transcriptional regulator, maltose regulon positive regulatory protein